MNRRQVVVLLAALTVTLGIWTLGVRPFDAVRVVDRSGMVESDPLTGRVSTGTGMTDVATTCPGPLRPAAGQIFSYGDDLGSGQPRAAPTQPCHEHRLRDQRLLGLAFVLTWAVAIVACVRSSSSRRRERGHPIPGWTAPAVIVRVWWLLALLLAVPAVLPFSYAVPYADGARRVGADGSLAAIPEVTYVGAYDVSCEAPLFQWRRAGNLPGISNGDYTNTCRALAGDRMRFVLVGEGVVFLAALIALTAQADLRDHRAKRDARVAAPAEPAAAGAP